ncbi:SFRICE_015007, partial [Gryllus bimaculatus]
QNLGASGVYSSFAPKEPVWDLRCGVARADSLLGTGTCDLKREYICEQGAVRPAPTPPPSPPLGYVAMDKYPHSLYKVHRDKASWETARRRCEGEGAHLMFVNSLDEADRVLKRTALPGWFWLGFDDFANEGEYVYLDGTRVADSGYERWATDEPTENLNCGVARTDGLLGTGTCKIEREYICEWDKPRAPPSPTWIPPGYSKIGNLGLYKVHRDRVQWETARRNCEAAGARLLIVNSQAEADAVLKTSGLPGWFWLGFDDFDNSGQYITLDGRTLRDAGYEKWDSGEPDKKLNCGVATVKGLLGTGNCKYNRGYICELMWP